MTDISIIGGGVAGLCVATELARRGHALTLHDPEGAPGAHGCSWWAGGMLAPECESESAEEPVVRLGRQAADWWARSVPVTREGTLVVAPARDGADLRHFARRTEGHRLVDAEEIATLEPDLGTRFRSGLLFADEGHLDPRKALGLLRAELAANPAVTLSDTAVDMPPPADGRLWIDCRGLAARDALPDLRGVRGEMMILRCPDVNLRRTVRMLHPRIPIYIVPRGDGIYMLGATMIEAEDRRQATARSVLELLSAAYALSPAFGEAEVLEIGVDLRPAFPDNLPRIRRRGNVIHANGLYRHGYLLAPALARQVADLVETGAKPEFMDEDNAERRDAGTGPALSYA
ncbi:thiamine biosynthesis protein thio [Brevirhabdus pacifica]|uniref:Thiamine biosynthesis protein thio n=1 Tax=Brevirhabdus pacifica TaxID=1267768 RepID=A0A1U7DMK1_9RHOB|nr:FAD-dependent oxidoreductase [Brevirhabdus pacifica]APX91201.1 thiamine biosynthesis protein thio [Brevirhabdus pacifica]PJJ87350.1 glycine oxidase [Brevirhabdus pacifica]